MNIYMILKAGSGQEEYNFLYHKYSINIVIWKAEQDVDTVIKNLFAEVKQQKKWKLFIADYSTIDTQSNPYSGETDEELKTLLQSSCFVNGKGSCRPPERIYVIRKRKKKTQFGNEGNFMYVEDFGAPSCRFLFMDCSEKHYLEELEKLKLASAIVLLGINEIPAEVMEAYIIYKIDVAVDENKLAVFLQDTEDALLREEMELRRSYQKVDLCEKQEIYDYRDYIPQLSAFPFAPLKLNNFFWGIKKADEDYKWIKKKNEIASRIDLIRNEQIYYQEELKKEIKERIRFLPIDNISLKEEEKEEIYIKIQNAQKELNNCYVDLWEVNSEMLIEKSAKEKTLEKLLNNRYSIKEVIFLLTGIMSLLIILFIILFGTEIWVKTGMGVMSSDKCLEILGKGFKRIGTSLFFFAVCFGAYWSLCSAVDIFKAERDFNETLNKINQSVKTNFSKYKKLFSLVYGLKSCQNFLTRNKNFINWKAAYLEKLKKKLSDLETEKKEFDELKLKFTHLLERENHYIEEESGTAGTNRFEKKIKINGNNKEIMNPLFFVDQISITKEVSDTNGIKLDI